MIIDGQEIEKQRAIEALPKILDALADTYGILKVEGLINTAVPIKMSPTEYKMKRDLLVKVKSVLEACGYETY